ncbi:MAG: diacylglycerol/polyprenol kinase family protein [Ignavibacteria bacterium]
MNPNLENNPTPFKGEVFRKLIHYSSAVIPVGYLFLDKFTVLSILVVLLFFMIVFEFLKYRNDTFYRFYLKYFRDMLREHEYDRFKFRINGASWVILSSIFCILLFPKLIAVTGLLMLSFADSSSALFGRIFGRKQYAPNRSYVGTAVFFVVGLLIALLTPKYFGGLKEYLIGFVMVIVTTIADGMSLPVDDNFTIPVVSCSVMYVLYMLLFPGIIF